MWPGTDMPAYEGGHTKHHPQDSAKVHHSRSSISSVSSGYGSDSMSNPSSPGVNSELGSDRQHRHPMESDDPFTVITKQSNRRSSSRMCAPGSSVRCVSGNEEPFATTCGKPGTVTESIVGESLDNLTEASSGTVVTTGKSSDGVGGPAGSLQCPDSSKSGESFVSTVDHMDSRDSTETSPNHPCETLHAKDDHFSSTSYQNDARTNSGNNQNKILYNSEEHIAGNTHDRGDGQSKEGEGRVEREQEAGGWGWGLSSLMVPLNYVRSLVTLEPFTPTSTAAYYSPTHEEVTIGYSVSGSDTLTSIAARFETTPSELTKLNKLSTRFVYPGQVIAVPDKSAVGRDKAGGGQQDSSEDHSEQDQVSHIRAPSPSQRGDARIPLSPNKYPRTPANSVELERSLDRECLDKFLKISVRHITDGQGVVAGVLLVTPNAVMFDPNVSDPLVIEHGPESYGVIAPMEFVVNAALYYDIAHMRVKDTHLPKPEIPKPEIYWGPGQVERTGSQESPGKDASLSKDTTFPELAASQDDNDSSCSCGGDTRESSAFPKAFEHELLTPIGSDVSPASGEGQPSPSQPSPSGLQQQSLPGVVGDLTPIAEATRSEDSLATTPNLAQTQCDKPAAQDLAQTEWPAAAPQSSDDPVCNEKKRTTSVTFDLTAEGEEPMPEPGSDASMQETRKQKVLKRLSYPLSWMESFNTDKENMPHQQAGGVHPTSAPPVAVPSSHPQAGDAADGGKAGVFSNVFSMSNVSNMLSRRPSMDFARRPINQQPLFGPGHHTPPQVSTTNTSTTQQQQQQQQLVQDMSPVNSKDHQAHKRTLYKEGPKFGLKSMVSMDDMPELFASFDKLIPKPATACEDPPLYLCLRMGKPAKRSIPKSTPVMSYGKKRMRPEYWFSIPKNRSDELYSFFQNWAQSIYGELNEEVVLARGFVLVDEETDLWTEEDQESAENDSGISGELTEMTKESWEVVSMSEELRRALYSSNSLTSLDLEAFLPDVIGTSEIITDNVRKSLYRKLPARAQGYSWKLVFSTSQHGFSLNSLYRKMSEVESPVILFIQDTHNTTFGAVLSCSLHVSELFYGTGESFLFSFLPDFQVFPWTGENTFFVKGNNESLVVGGGDGNFGLWLDGDLYQGRTQPCKTFNNPQLTDTEDFIIKAVEVWCFE